MTGKQQIVLWIGLILIAFRFFTTGQWQQLWLAISTPGPSSGGGNQNNGDNPPWWYKFWNFNPFTKKGYTNAPTNVNPVAPAVIPAPGVVKSI